MEYLPYSLLQLLKKKVPLKTDSTLLAVANGLNYLHQKHPPIIHCDVTATNVLLTTEYRAKLASFGSAIYIDKQPFTTAPSVSNIMPPEALEHNPVYSDKLDVFSFGCLILHILTGNFPVPTDPKAKVSEWDRRAYYVKQVLDNKLIPLARQCLEDDPARRLNMNEIIEEIRHNRHDPSHSLHADEIFKKLEQQLKQQEQELQKFQHQLQKEGKEKTEKEQDIQSYRNQLLVKERELQKKERELQAKDEEIQQKERQLQEKSIELHQSQNTIRIYQQKVLADDHWVINKVEVILTDTELGRGSYATVKVGILEV